MGDRLPARARSREGAHTMRSWITCLLFIGLVLNTMPQSTSLEVDTVVPETEILPEDATAEEVFVQKMSSAAFHELQVKASADWKSISKKQALDTDQKKATQAAKERDNQPAEHQKAVVLQKKKQ